MFSASLTKKSPNVCTFPSLFPLCFLNYSGTVVAAFFKWETFPKYLLVGKENSKHFILLRKMGLEKLEF